MERESNASEPALAESSSTLHATSEKDTQEMDGHSLLQPREDAASDGDNERPVREKLKKTSINALPKQNATPGGEIEAENQSEETSDTSKAREVPEDDHSSTEKNVTPTTEPAKTVSRKRSFEVSDLDEAAEANGRPLHSRKRSRSQSPPKETEEATPTESEDKMEQDKLLGPKKKRSRDQFDKDTAGDSEVVAEPSTKRLSGEFDRGIRSTREEPEKKRPRDLSQGREVKEVEQQAEKTKKSAGGFGDTSSISPFATAPPTKEAKTDASQKATNLPQTSQTAFAASGFGAHAASAGSPFGGFGGSSTGQSPFTSFASPSKEAPSSSKEGNGGIFKPSVAPLSSFASAAKNTSAFGGTTSSFGGSIGGGGFGGSSGLGGGFGQPLGGGLKGFGTPGASKIVGLEKSTAKPFGAPAEEASSGSGDGSDGETEDDKEDRKDKPDHRFQPQEVDTGEAGEETVLSCRAKMFAFDRDTKAWKERGTGPLKLNVPEDFPASSDLESEGAVSPKPGSKKPRIIMRSDGVMRVVLNAPLTKEMDPKIADNQPTVVSMIIFEEGKPQSISLRVNTAANAKLLKSTILSLTSEE